MLTDTMRVSGGCHCGRVRFEAETIDGLSGALRCTCSICRMRGATIVFAALDAFYITSGADSLTEYRFNTNAARHFFCKTCGIYTHHQRRFDPSQYAINVGCLDGVQALDLAEVRVVDGVNHPLDGDGVLRTIGTLRFVAATEKG